MGIFNRKKPVSTINAKIATVDSFQNSAANLGIGTDNLSSVSGYGYNPISVNRLELEYAYRGSWVVGNACDIIADDMVQAGITLKSTMKPDNEMLLLEQMQDLRIWDKLNEAIRWGRLYGGAVAVLLIEGQNWETPLDIETIDEGQFKGLLVMDRWQLLPDITNLIGYGDGEISSDMGLPRFYNTIGDAILPNLGKIHYTRVLRFEGYDLPHYQKSTNMLWGTSIIERINDRLIAFDSVSTGIAQLAFKAYLRTWKIDGLRDLVGSNTTGAGIIQKTMAMVRRFQSNEGITLIDAKDDFQTHQYNFSGLDDILLGFGQQLSGALEIPLVRFFGQSPAGMNATGESDLRTYYDGIRKKQETRLRNPVKTILRCLSFSTFGEDLPKGTTFKFNPLWQMNDKERADIGTANTQSIINAYESGLISQSVAMMELKQMSEVSGLFTNITDEDLNEAELTPPSSSEITGNEENEED